MIAHRNGATWETGGCFTKQFHLRKQSENLLLEAEATVVAEDKEAVEKDDKNVSVELIYDSVLACYFDPSTGRYYEIQQES